MTGGLDSDVLNSLKDPHASEESLGRICLQYPQWRAAVVAHPNVTPALLQWLAASSEEAVAFAARQRLSGLGAAEAKSLVRAGSGKTTIWRWVVVMLLATAITAAVWLWPRYKDVLMPSSDSSPVPSSIPTNSGERKSEVGTIPLFTQPPKVQFIDAERLVSRSPSSTLHRVPGSSFAVLEIKGGPQSVREEPTADFPLEVVLLGINVETGQQLWRMDFKDYEVKVAFTQDQIKKTPVMVLLRCPSSYALAQHSSCFSGIYDVGMGKISSAEKETPWSKAKFFNEYLLFADSEKIVTSTLSSIQAYDVNDPAVMLWRQNITQVQLAANMDDPVIHGKYAQREGAYIDIRDGSLAKFSWANNLKAHYLTVIPGSEGSLAALESVGEKWRWHGVDIESDRTTWSLEQSDGYLPWQTGKKIIFTDQKFISAYDIDGDKLNLSWQVGRGGDDECSLRYADAHYVYLDCFTHIEVISLSDGVLAGKVDTGSLVSFIADNGVIYTLEYGEDVGSSPVYLTAYHVRDTGLVKLWRSVPLQYPLDLRMVGGKIVLENHDGKIAILGQGDSELTVFEHK